MGLGPERKEFDQRRWRLLTACIRHHDRDAEADAVDQTADDANTCRR
jgi:hypothetical protein